jgi:hypothetical protein
MLPRKNDQTWDQTPMKSRVGGRTLQTLVYILALKQNRESSYIKLNLLRDPGFIFVYHPPSFFFIFKIKIKIY